MRPLIAARLVRAKRLDMETLWLIATDPERITVALLLGRPEQLPATASSPALAWNGINQQQRRLLLDHAPESVRRALPADVDTN